MKNVVHIFTDGACRGNPGIGGWGVVLRYQEKTKTINGSESHTTNNRMELMAAIEALRALKKSCVIQLTTDSKYVKEGVTEWMPKWKKNGWKTANRQPVKNVDLWQALDLESARHEITWHWIKGHAGHADNELADRLANEAIDQLLKRT